MELAIGPHLFGSLGAYENGIEREKNNSEIYVI